MTALVYASAEWFAARERRARAGKAPRLALRRCIMLRQQADGTWCVGIYTWKLGRWLKPDWVCPPASLAQARGAARAAWQQSKLPIMWHYSGRKGLQPFRFGYSEPGEDAS